MNDGPHHRQALPASIEESILCSAVARLGVSGALDNYSAIIKPINVSRVFGKNAFVRLVRRVLSFALTLDPNYIESRVL